MTQQRVSPVVITSVLPATVTLSVQGALGQSANLQEWKDSTGTILSRVSSAGTIVVSASGTRISGAFGDGLFIVNNAAVVPMTVRGFTSQTANLQEWQTSAGITTSFVSPAGGLAIGGGSLLSGTVGVLTLNASTPGIVVRGAASQTANLQQWQISDGTVRSAVDTNGFIIVGGTTSISNAMISARPFGATQVGIAVRGTAGQSGNLQNWENSSATITASVDPSGNIRGTSVRSINDYSSLLEANSGGYVRLTKQTAATPNPGAGLGSLYFRDGTNAGTLKLVVRAGAAGAETTILDNIPQ